MNTIVYITVKAPYSSGESFILTEMFSLKNLGIDILVIPRDVSGGVIHEKAGTLLNNTLRIKWFDPEVIREALKYIFMNPVSFLKLIDAVVLKARNAKIALRNLMILPKGVYLARLLGRHPVSHIHAHWASTTSTLAYVISQVTGIPWSFTAHRWDIAEDNLLKEKCHSASFVRTIAENGRREILEIVGNDSLANKLSVIHMGVIVPENKSVRKEQNDVFTFLCPADFIAVKGHRYLLDACRMLSDSDIKFKCLLAGDGPLEDKLRQSVRYLQLNHCVEFLGRLPHEKLMGLYERGAIDAVVLPSIITEDGEKEGIPVALMEGMSYGIPVIATSTGGIPELIGDGSGIMIEEKNPEAIAGEIKRLIKEPSHYELIREKGNKKIKEEFDVVATNKRLLELFFAGACNQEEATGQTMLRLTI